LAEVLLFLIKGKNKESTMKYLVTGGCGFIGSHLCDALIDAGHQVRVLDNLSTGVEDNLPSGVELLLGSVMDRDLVKRAMQDIDGCFHLAAVSSVTCSLNDWVGTHCNNQQGTVNLLDAARRNGEAPTVPVVYASSAAVYGDNATVPLNESSIPWTISEYGADNLGIEDHARVAWLAHGVSTVCMRFFNVYGPRQSPASPYSGVISIFIERLLKGQPLSIHGDGKQTRDFIYVADVVRFLIAAMHNQKGEASVYNVCTGQPTSILQLAKTLSMLSGSEPQLNKMSCRQGDIVESLGEPKRANKRYGFTAQVTLGDGLKLMLETMA
jgi:UDP-glucose 4-epimerase